MTSDSRPSDAECSEFQQQLPSFFDSGADLVEHPHISTCENCASLVRDLQYIAAQAKLLLPMHDPSPEVWENIHSALSKKTKSCDDHA